MFTESKTYIIVYLISIVIISIIIPRKYTDKLLAVFILIAVLLYIVIYDKKKESNETNKKNLLQKYINTLSEKHYIKNNENIPLRTIKGFRYIYVDERIIDILLELFIYVDRYSDVVYSVLFYTEAFMRQIYRTMDNKVNDDKLAKTLLENIINQLQTLSYESSKYEKSHIKMIQDKFIHTLWNIYIQIEPKVSKYTSVYDPSPSDPTCNNNYDLYII